MCVSIQVLKYSQNQKKENAYSVYVYIRIDAVCLCTRTGPNMTGEIIHYLPISVKRFNSVRSQIALAHLLFRQITVLVETCDSFMVMSCQRCIANFPVPSNPRSPLTCIAAVACTSAAAAQPRGQRCFTCPCKVCAAPVAAARQQTTRQI